MRRRAGVGAIQRQKIQQDKFKEKGSEIQENQLEQVLTQIFFLFLSKFGSYVCFVYKNIRYHSYSSL